MSERGDLEIVRACAIAMEYDILEELTPAEGIIVGMNRQYFPDETDTYNPLLDDAQCFALVKKFKFQIAQLSFGCKVFKFGSTIVETEDIDLNRAICLAVAKLSRAG